MTSSTAVAPRRGFFRRGGETGPRARLRDLLPYLAEHRGPIVAVIVLSIIGAALSLAQPLLVEQVVTRVQKAQPLGGVVALVAVIVAVGAVLSGAQHYLLQRTGTSVVLSARTRLIRHLLRLPVADFDRRRTGDLVARVGTDTTLLYAVLTQGLVDAVGGAFTFVGAIIGMALLDPVLLGLTVLIVLFAIVVVGGLARRIRVASRAQQDAVGALTADVERSISAVRTIRASGATERETESVLQGAKRAWDAGLDVAKASAPVVPVASLTLNLAFLVVIGVGGFRVASGAIGDRQPGRVPPVPVPDGDAARQRVRRGQLGGERARCARPDHGGARAAVRDRDRRGGPDASRPARTRPRSSSTDVSFSYRGADGERVDVLHDVTFAVPRGTRTALVGPSGAGKSTMLSLLERFYDIDSGAVRLGGVDLRRLPRDVLRSPVRVRRAGRARARRHDPRQPRARRAARDGRRLPPGARLGEPARRRC